VEGSIDRKRLKLEIIADVLRELHVVRKNGKVATNYLLERHLGLKGTRLKDLLDELRHIGLVDDRMRPTNRGYAYLQEFSSKVLPFLERYGL
jgi:predicted transcriptional regulator